MKTMNQVLNEVLATCEAMLKFPKAVNRDTVRMWEIVLKDFDPHVVGQAFERWIRTKSEFPVPCEILEVCRDIRQHHALSSLQFEVEPSALPGPPATAEERAAIRAEMSDGPRRILDMVTRD